MPVCAVLQTLKQCSHYCEMVNDDMGIDMALDVARQPDLPILGKTEILSTLNFNIDVSRF